MATRKAQIAALVSETAPLAEREAEAARVNAIVDAMYKPDPPKATRQEFRALLKKAPSIAYIVGTLPTMVRNESLGRFTSLPVLEESFRFQLEQLQADLAGASPLPIERLLIDVICQTYEDYWHFSMLYASHTGKGLTLSEIEQWERVLNAKEQRYLRAIAELARVRRLLNLPAPQVNINMPGGQQVNVNGKV